MAGEDKQEEAPQVLDNESVSSIKTLESEGVVESLNPPLVTQEAKFNQDKVKIKKPIIIDSLSDETKDPIPDNFHEPQNDGRYYKLEDPPTSITREPAA